MDATPAAIPALRHRAGDFARGHGAAEALVEKVALAVSEAVTNTVKYGYPAGSGQVTIAAAVNGGTLDIVVSDRGNGFREGVSNGMGLGLPIIAEVTGDLEISQGPAGTSLRMTFPLSETS